MIECGSFLGELKNELNVDEHIVEFCSTGPKCYSYLTSKNVEVVHVKGFKVINNDVDGLINYASMNDVVCDRGKTISMKRNEISRNDNLCMFSENVEKKIAFIFDKTILLDDYSSIPYGNLL